jgi:methylated-DNA-protein-cysteine methyltransferase related protein
MRFSKDSSPEAAPVGHAQIYAVVKRIPKGKVATYGQISRMVGRCTARMVGYAMAAVPEGSRVPWQRVINSQGMISARTNSDGDVRQRVILEKEGVTFDANGKVDLMLFQWQLSTSPLGPAVWPTASLSSPRKRKFIAT